MRSSAVLLVALVGVASAGIPNWPFKRSESGSNVYGGGVVPTGKPPLGPGPVSFPTGSPIDHTSGGIFPTGGPKSHHSERYTHTPTGSGIKPTGSGLGPTGTGHGGSPVSTPGPHTTTITKTSDVTGEWLIVHFLLTWTNIDNRHNDFHIL